MKSIFFAITLLMTANAFAAYPFTISGDKIKAIFQSEKLWRKLGGAVETIVFKDHSNNTSKFAVTTTESVAIVNSAGVITGYKNSPCMVLVDVTAKGDELAPQWEVSSVDFTACPAMTGK
ncbi:MAG: hypothetical protein ACXWRE_05305 [Pseudobdellovibrionaceae bacterium]